MQNKTPFLSMPLITDIGVNIHKQLQSPVDYWKPHLTQWDGLAKVLFLYISNAPPFNGMLSSFVIDLSIIGEIRINPMFVGQVGSSPDFYVFDATHDLFQVDYQLSTLRDLADEKWNWGQKQDKNKVQERERETRQPGIEVLNNEHMTQIVKVAQMIVMQRLAWRYQHAPVR